MTVYVDESRIRYTRMTMCHMIADTHEELVEMADKIGVKRKWIQHEGTWKEHFDICLTKRAKAIKHGAQSISFLGLGRKLAERRKK